MISKRLLAICQFVKKGAVIVDIGTDHAYLPIYLVQKQICPRAIAVDILSGPLNQAIKDIQAAKLTAQITCLLSHGLQAVTQTFDTIIMAGLGGATIKKILAETPTKTQLANDIIIQANNGIHLVRKYLTNNGYYIENEEMVAENNLIYPIVHFTKGQRVYNQMELFYGPLLLKNKNKYLVQQIQLDIAHYHKILNQIPTTSIIKHQTISDQYQQACQALELLTK